MRSSAYVFQDASLAKKFSLAVFENEKISFFTLEGEHRRTGLRFSLVPMEGRRQVYLGLHVPYGANDLRFSPGEQEVPPGTAHFLEHCVFHRAEEAEGRLSLMQEMAALGADCNAFTTKQATLYYADLMGKMEEAMRLFLPAVLHPQVDEARVEAEKQIILAEYRMYMDDPDILLYQDAMENLYAVHPQRYDIVGTEESILGMTSADLHRAIAAFYTPQQLHLSLAGGFEVEEALRILDELLQEEADRGEDPLAEGLPCLEEPSLPHRLLSTAKREVATPSFILTIKEEVPAGLSAEELQLRMLEQNLLSLLLLGPTSPVVEGWMQEGLINDSLAFQHSLEEGVAHWMLSAESHEPEKAVERIRDFLQHSPALDPRLVEELRRQIWGENLFSLDSVHQTGALAAKLSRFKVNLVQFQQLLTEETLAKTLPDLPSSWADPSRYSVAYQFPKEEEE